MTESNELAQQNMFSSIFDSMDDEVSVVWYSGDRVGEIAYVNRAKAMRMGLTVDEIIGKTITELTTKEQAQEIIDLDLSVYNFEVEVKDLVKRVIKPDGEELCLSVTITHWVVGLKIVGIVNVGRDVTKRKQVEEMMIYGLLAHDHEIKNINTAIGTAANIIKEGVKIEKNDDCLNVIIAESKRLEQVCNRVYARGMAMIGGIKARKKMCDVRHEFFDWVLNKYADKIERHGIFIDRSYGEIAVGEVQVPVDCNLIRDAISELVFNAIKYCNGTISVGCENYPDHIRINVYDNGPGVPEKDKPSLFKKHKGEMARHEKSGSGWGLYLVGQIIKAHGGEIWCETTKSGHANFILTLPK